MIWRLGRGSVSSRWPDDEVGRYGVVLLYYALSEAWLMASDSGKDGFVQARTAACGVTNKGERGCSLDRWGRKVARTYVAFL
jgi:hypothetical protein